MSTTTDTQPQRCVAPQATTTPPRQKLPEGSTDCHCHVFEDPRLYPLQSNRSYTPDGGTLAEYLAMCGTVGLTRTVQVSASVYGTDNSLTLDVIAKLGQERARGVAGLMPDTPMDELQRLHDGGIRGVRLSTSLKGYGGTDAIHALAPRVRPLGWHVQLHVRNSDELAVLEPELMRVPVPLVFDHLGCIRGGQGVNCSGFQAMLRLLRQREDCWVKISSWYRRSDQGGPDYADMLPFVQAVVDARPDRCVFGTNWPHPRLFDPAQMVDDGNLVDQFCEWLPDATLRHRILVENPGRLYFGER
jgi:predicted TIM-barrel fold metal-dependent hydrolase